MTTPTARYLKFTRLAFYNVLGPPDQADLHLLRPEEAKSLIAVLDQWTQFLADWIGQLRTAEKALEKESKKLRGRRLQPHEQVRRDEIEVGLRQIETGIFHDKVEEGIASVDLPLLKILREKWQDAEGVKFNPPGMERASIMLARIGRDRAYLAAVVERWPTPEKRHPYKLMRMKPWYDAKGREYNHGDVVQLTYDGSDSITNIFRPAEELPEIIEQYDLAQRRAESRWGLAVTDISDEINPAIRDRARALLARYLRLPEDEREEQEVEA
jgi:hypothetical protein